MTNLILGTAGHIDHGKTALIKSLTGFDCDTHPAEKLRGITINLGFSHLDLPNGSSIGIVDVPGHHDFVNTMIAGAHGIDLLMLVIAADSGIMPQTVEHLQIAQALKIKYGLVVLTKADLVDEDSISLVESEVKEFLKNTFLDGCKIVKVSAATGDGIDQLKDQLVELASTIQKKESSEIFRMYIDRIFSVSGFGTVVTGSVLGGMINKSDCIYLLPSSKELRIRRMERHGKETEQINSGNRVSINLSGLNKEEFSRGMLLSDRIILPTTLLDAKLKLFSDVKNIRAWSDIIFLSGTFKNQAKMRLLKLNETEEEKSALVQIHLSEPCVVLRGDKFIVRSTSGLQTLGGGEIIDPYPLHHKKITQKLIDQLEKITEANSAEIIFYEVRKRRIPVSIKSIIAECYLRQAEIDESILISLPEDITAVNTYDDTYLVLKSTKEKIKSRVIISISNYHKKNPLVAKGRTNEELISAVGVEVNTGSEFILNTVLDELITQKKIRKVEDTWSLFSHSASLNESEQERVKFVENYFKNSRMQTPLMSELINFARQKGIDEKKLKQILVMLVEENRLYRIDGDHLHSSIVDKCRNVLLNYLNYNSTGITVAGFRDLVKGNRKISLLMLNLFDNEGITFRERDVRKITESGKKFLLHNE